MRSKKTIAVIGAGSWGTALAMLLARNQQTVNLWGWDLPQLQLMQKQRCNHRYLPDIPFPDSLRVCFDAQETLHAVDDVLLAVPAKGIKNTLQQIKPFLHGNSRLTLASKGLDPGSLRPLHEVIQAEVGKDKPLAIVSGPTFAIEVAQGLPTAVTLASEDEDFAQVFSRFLQNDLFRVYTSDDVVGVEIAGTVKNVMAIAAGIADGMGFGANTRAALITRGLHEMSQLGKQLGGKPETFMGLAGLGDLILTCTDDKSRNRRVGLGLAAGKSTEDILIALGQVAEGVPTAKNVRLLANKFELEMPIVDQVFEVIYHHKSPAQAVQDLLKREPRSEGYG
ncbi:MAG TPA: NAD(P)-dependent glycerol-3-phosphate dehydrogenase [Gammaproteobacteria bacterium]|nr:NAD(P)-dependent glycerol-3-phosphate dehydrogenase [Gammaproteobacteria bacterium]